jgi:hypothetical protein
MLCCEYVATDGGDLTGFESAFLVYASVSEEANTKLMELILKLSNPCIFRWIYSIILPIKCTLLGTYEC